MNNFNDMTNFIWSVADLIRGPYRPNQYKDVMLPLIVLRRLDCILEPTKEAVLEEYEKVKHHSDAVIEKRLKKVSKQEFFNTSPLDFMKLRGEPENIVLNLNHYIQKFSAEVRKIFDHFKFEPHIEKLDKHDRLYLLVSKVCEIDLHPDKVSNIEMGYIFEDLIRRFNEASNEEAGDHFTPREVIWLMVNLLFDPDDETLTKEGVVKTLYDPACGTGGMLSVSEEYLRKNNPDGRLFVYGQDYNDQAYAICGSDMLIKGYSSENIYMGNSFTDDHFEHEEFDYMLANPPFGVEWKAEKKVIIKEHEQKGFSGRFGPGYPRINDGSFLFLLHMMSKMKDFEKGGTRLGIVFSGSPLFTGSAGSGESDIRKYIIEHDYLEGIIALPDQLFYNTGINTYIWIVTNRKEKHRKGKIQLIDATTYFDKMRKSLGNKRHIISEGHIDEITRLYGGFKEGEHVKIFDNEDFGYSKVKVERPLKLNFLVDDERLSVLKENKTFVNLATSKKRKDEAVIEKEIAEGRKKQKEILTALEGLKGEGMVKDCRKFSKLLKKTFKDEGLKVTASLMKNIMNSLSERDETAEVCKDNKGQPKADPDLRDYENIPLKEDIGEYMDREVYPHVPDAWIDESWTRIGYEINFNRYFYKYEPPRALEDIEADLRKVDTEIQELMKEVLD